jgi:hypothetical protein
MTVRPSEADRKPNANKSELSGSASRRALLTVRAALILAGGLVTGVTTGLLAYFVVRNLAQSVLVGIPACAGAIRFLDFLIA